MHVKPPILSHWCHRWQQSKAHLDAILPLLHLKSQFPNLIFIHTSLWLWQAQVERCTQTWCRHCRQRTCRNCRHGWNLRQAMESWNLRQAMKSWNLRQAMKPWNLRQAKNDHQLPSHHPMRKSHHLSMPHGCSHQYLLLLLCQCYEIGSPSCCSLFLVWGIVELLDGEWLSQLLRGMPTKAGYGLGFCVFRSIFCIFRSIVSSSAQAKWTLF